MFFICLNAALCELDNIVVVLVVIIWPWYEIFGNSPWTILSTPCQTFLDLKCGHWKNFRYSVIEIGPGTEVIAVVLLTWVSKSVRQKEPCKDGTRIVRYRSQDLGAIYSHTEPRWRRFHWSRDFKSFKVRSLALISWGNKLIMRTIWLVSIALVWF